MKLVNLTPAPVHGLCICALLISSPWAIITMLFPVELPKLSRHKIPDIFFSMTLAIALSAPALASDLASESKASKETTQPGAGETASPALVEPDGSYPGGAPSGSSREVQPVKNNESSVVGEAHNESGTSSDINLGSGKVGSGNVGSGNSADSRQSSQNATAKSTAPSLGTSEQVPASGPKLQAFLKAKYMEYQAAFLKAKSFEDLLPYRTKKQREDMEKKLSEARKSGANSDGLKELQGMFDLMKAMQPRNVVVESVAVNGDRAELKATASDSGEMMDSLEKGLTGVMQGMVEALVPAPGKGAVSQKIKSSMPKTVTTGKIVMLKESGQWKMDTESWSSTSSNVNPAEQAKKDASSLWCSKALDMDYPRTPAAGKIHGQPFKVQGAEISGQNILTIREGNDFFADRKFVIFLFDVDGQPDRKQILVKNGEPVSGKSKAHIHMGYKVAGKDLPKTEIFFPSDGFGLKLSFGQRKGDLLPGYIVLRMPDKEQSFVQGYFYAKIAK